MVIAADIQMPLQMWIMLREMVEQWLAMMAPASAESAQIVGRIGDWKLSNGLVERYEHPELAGDSATKRARTKAWHEALRPRHAGEVVCPGGGGKDLWVIRVNMNENPRLHALYLMRAGQREKLLRDVCMRLFPFLTLEAKK